MAEAIQIQVNGEQRSCRADATVGDLLRELAIKTERVAVELNLEIMDRKDFDHRSLKQGDRVEVLSFIGGGAPVASESKASCGETILGGYKIGELYIVFVESQMKVQSGCSKRPLVSPAQPRRAGVGRVKRSTFSASC